MSYLAKLILVAAVTLTALPASAQETSDRYGVSQDWAMFAEEGLCWVTTTNSGPGRRIYLSITVFKGKRDPQVSVMADQRLPRSAGLSLRVGDQRYALKSNGRSAWPPKSADKKIIARLQKSDGAAARQIMLEQPGIGDITFSADGFRKAFAETLNMCDRATD